MKRWQFELESKEVMIYIELAATKKKMYQVDIEKLMNRLIPVFSDVPLMISFKVARVSGWHIVDLYVFF